MGQFWIPNIDTFGVPEVKKEEVWKVFEDLKDKNFSKLMNDWKPQMQNLRNSWISVLDSYSPELIISVSLKVKVETDNSDNL